MSKNLKSRFSVSEQSIIEEKYVLYVEDLYVSFVADNWGKQIDNQIQMKKDLIDSFGKKGSSSKKKEIKRQIKELRGIKKFKPQKEMIKELKTKLRLTKDKEQANSIKKRINDIKTEVKMMTSVEKEVLKGITFGLRQGETLALVGANGAGKTVLIETILGMNIPKKYKRILLNLGHKTNTKNLKEIGIQYQQSKIQSNLRVKDAIKSQANLYGKRVDFEEVNKMMEAFGIVEFISMKVESLSGGQKQRLNLLLAIMHQPKLMILDEFITGLDVKTVRNIITYVNQLKHKNNASMIIISHQPEEIEELADRILVMKDGKIVDQTTPEKVIKEFGDTARFLEGVI